MAIRMEYEFLVQRTKNDVATECEEWDEDGLAEQEKRYGKKKLL